jgi:hypothetical protein
MRIPQQEKNMGEGKVLPLYNCAQEVKVLVVFFGNRRIFMKKFFGARGLGLGVSAFGVVQA